MGNSRLLPRGCQTGSEPGASVSTKETSGTCPDSSVVFSHTRARHFWCTLHLGLALPSNMLVPWAHFAGQELVWLGSPPG